MTPSPITRQELYDAVWTTPPSRLAAEYGLTQYRFTRVCQKLRVPLPTNRYWTCLRNGKQLPRTSLPAPEASSEYEPVDLAPQGVSALLGDKLSRPRLPGVSLPESIHVPAQLRSLHPLVAATKDRLERRAWLDRYGKRKICGSGVLDVSVSPGSVKRALRLLNALIVEAERYGLQVATTHDKHHAAYFQIEEVRIRFGLTEKMDRERRPGARPGAYDEWEYHPTGMLSIWLTDEPWHPFRPVSDGKTKRLEDQLHRVLEVTSELALKAREERLQIEAWHRERRRVEAIEAAERQRAEEEQQRRQELEQHAEQWTRGQHILGFVDAVETRLAAMDLDPEARSRADAWLRWAREHAERMDPLAQQVGVIIGGATD